MKIIVNPSEIEGSLKANPSKSYMQRALALTGLSGRPMTICNPCRSADSMAALSIVQKMGYKTYFEENSLILTPEAKNFEADWHAGESGLSARMFAIIAGLYDREITLTGQGSLLSRPVTMSENILRQLGVSVRSNNGFLPITIKGPVADPVINTDAKDSSQALTGLLMALPFGKKDAEIRLTGLKSRPYIAMTLDILEKFGIEIRQNDLKHFAIHGRQNINLDHFCIEGDWSSASFALVAGAIAGQCTVDQLNITSVQGDRNILGILDQCGASIQEKDNSVTITKSGLKAFEYDAQDTPDLFPPLVALAANCYGTTKIHGVSRLAFKESNRYEALRQEFGKLRIHIGKEGDTMLIEGGKIHGGFVNTYNDHRIAMALFVAALCAKGQVVIEGMECISKSYPGFLEDMKILNADYDFLEP